MRNRNYDSHGELGGIRILDRPRLFLDSQTQDLRGFLDTQISLLSIAVTPATPSIASGGTQQFIATGTYSDGSHIVLTSVVSWGSSDHSKATINDSGLATGVAAGPSTISATLRSISGNTILTVT